ncbi:MAG: nitroreductase, partial [Bacteroidales bacterium]|nr:nitroreductase [Bacteroidales bacterium]
AQSMLLKAVEMGYNGLIIGAFNAKKIEEAFALPYPPILILAIGKGNENIQLKEISADESHAYYRENGVHVVPKVRWEELIIGS